ncbi:MAG: valine--tRNA ligase [Nanoarchaeota archaeon]
MTIPDRYNPKDAEPKWQKYWEEQNIYEFHPDRKKETYAVDTPPPTVSGKMHLGHAFSYSQQDFIVRYQRMRGKNVFFPFGTDDNGLPTERLVEKKKNILSTKMSRVEFVKICNEVIEQEKPLFIKSWKEIGMSADFKRSYSTINRHCQIISQASFIELYQKGLVYQQESPNTFCVSCQTAIAQAEFENMEMTSHFNDVVFKCGSQDLIIGTTRPELIPACVALFYHPADQRYQLLKGKFAVVPRFNYQVPILSDENVDKEKGTGLMMVCTFGDKDDVDKWHRYQLPLRVVIDKQGRMNELGEEFKGLKIKEARKAILDKLKQENLLLRQQEIVHAVNVHERCKTEIEFLKTKQWYIRLLDKKEELLEAANQITWYPAHMKVRYDHWVQNLNWDWCISRQRHFGIPIPVWRCKSCGTVVLPDLRDLPVDPSVQKPGKKCGCGSADFIGEQDVLDTWATSSLTPEIAGNWLHQGEYDLKFNSKEPFALRPQAHDIIRTWLFYTMVKSLYHHGRVPWKWVMISGHAQDPQGRKMSKSLGNIIEPQAMIQKYSADCLRFWAAGSKLGDDLPFLEKDLVTGQKFITKLWNAARFCLSQLQDYEVRDEPSILRSKLPQIPEAGASRGVAPYGDAAPTENEARVLKMLGSFKGKEGRKRTEKITEPFDAWLLSKVQKLIQECTETFDRYEYFKTKAEVEQFFWHTFCDHYLEIVKDRLYNPTKRGTAARASAQYTLYATLISILKMIAPILPHCTEEIYQLYFAGKEQQQSIHISSWPEFNKKLIDEKAELAGEIGVDIINTVRKYKSEQHWSMKQELKGLILVSSEPGFLEIIHSLQEDLKAVLKVQALRLTGVTTMETEKFAVKVGVEG